VVDYQLVPSQHALLSIEAAVNADTFAANVEGYIRVVHLAIIIPDAMSCCAMAFGALGLGVR